MTIRELMDKLASWPMDMKVITDLHSEYAPVDEIYSVDVYDNDGYISRAYRPQDILRSRPHLYIGAREKV